MAAGRERVPLPSLAEEAVPSMRAVGAYKGKFELYA